MIFDEQKKYNHAIKQSMPPMPLEEWALNYLTGLSSEAAEVLEQLNWRHHRRSFQPIDRTALALELADLTKYIHCLWLNFGYDETDMLTWTEIKSELLEFRRQQEFSTPPENKQVLITDLDGTLADWRGGFLHWLLQRGHIRDHVPHDPLYSLSMDLDMRWSYEQYIEWKDEFERSGGYASLPPYPDGISFIQNCTADHIIVATARPVSIARIRYDTYKWLKHRFILPDAIHLIGDERVQLAINLRDQFHNKVLLLEDNPDIALRAAGNGIPVIMRAAGYNEHAKHYYIHRTITFSGLEKGIWIS
jgi:hypothetical protein